MDLRVESRYDCGDVINYEVHLKKGYQGKTVLCLRLTGPDNEEYPFCPSRIVIEGNNYQGKIPLAFNMKGGNYKLAVTEVVTKKQVTKEFKIG